MVRGFAAILGCCFALASAPAEEHISRGTCRFTPGPAEQSVPKRYHLDSQSFEYQLSHRFDLRHCGVSVYNLAFPSPVKSSIPQNNTVYGEYFVPIAATSMKKVPGVLVLDIMDGAAVVARGEAVWLAQHGVASLFVHMAHYGPRRPPGSKVRLVSPNIDATLAAVRQTVLDCRLAVAWLASRPEIDANHLGLVGTSLGSIIGSNVAAAEPRLKNVCLLLPAGGLVDAFYDHPKAKPYLPLLKLMGGKKMLKRLIAPLDPITYAPLLSKRNVLILAASRDDILPPSAARALWAATGKQKIIWFNSTHVGAAAFILPALQAITAHVKER